MTSRKIILISAGAVAAVLTIASAAFACTYVYPDSKTYIKYVYHQGDLSSPECDQSGSATGSCSIAHVGDVILATAEGIDDYNNSGGKNIPWRLHYLSYDSWSDSMGTCMGTPATPDVVIGGPKTSSSSGTIASTIGVIPGVGDDAPLGTGFARVCFIAGSYTYATKHASLTVSI